jgi:alpha-mannosidase
VFLIGQSHIDAAWLWPWAETHQILDDTFRQACDFMEEFDFFRYAQTSAAYFQDVERRNPVLFARIQKAVAAGRWEMLGGSWVESDMNMPSGEALVRQFLYGQRYFQEKFGVACTVSWVPDAFGMPASLPQILKKSGMDSLYFLRCAPKTAAFLWEGLDGTRLLSYSPEIIDFEFEDVNNLPFGEPTALCALMQGLFDKSNTNALVELYGIGDHGGGPTRQAITVFRRIAELPGMPQMHFATARQTMDYLQTQQDKLPVVSGELNPIFPGCFAGHADVKQRNRRNEILLQDAEKLSVMAGLVGSAYPAKLIAQTWEPLLFNQFHDILPGTAVREAYQEADALYDQVEETGNRLCKSAMKAVAVQMDTQVREGYPVVVFNTLGWTRSDVVTVKLDYDEKPQRQRLLVSDEAGAVWPAQVIGDEKVYETFYRCDVRFVAKHVPPFGAKCFWVIEAGGMDGPLTGTDVTLSDMTMENEFLRIVVDKATGCLASVFDKRLNHDTLGEPAVGSSAARPLGNLLTLQVDDNSPGDFWGHYTAEDIKLAGPPSPLGPPVSVEALWPGPVAAAIRVRYEFGNSRLEQDISLTAGSPLVCFDTTVDWREHRKMLSVCFPSSARAETYTAHIPFGALARPCDGLEMPAQRWIDLSDSNGGLAVVNDSKYGQSVEGSTLRVTLLRGSTDPDPVADVGLHVFAYALCPHAGDWRSAGLMRTADGFNAPLRAAAAERHPGQPPAPSLCVVDTPNVTVETIKGSEDGTGVVVRLYETAGQAATTTLAMPDRWTNVSETDLIERPQQEIAVERTGSVLRIPVDIKPCEILTLLLSN